MPMTTSTVSHGLTTLQIKPRHRSQSFFFNPIFRLATSKHRDGRFFPGNRSFRYLSTGQREQIDNNKPKMDLAVYSSVDPEGSPFSFWPPENSWQWILGVVATLVLPFLWNKWGPLLKLTKEVESAAETVERVADVVEKVAEDVEKLAADIADDLPGGGKVKSAVTFVENVAKETANDAQLAEDLLDKVLPNTLYILIDWACLATQKGVQCVEVHWGEVEEVDQKVESFMESAGEKSNQTAKEA